jgi:hypothetical protein
MEYPRTLATPAAESFARVILSCSGWPAVHPVVLIPVIVASHCPFAGFVKAIVPSACGVLNEVSSIAVPFTSEHAAATLKITVPLVEASENKTPTSTAPVQSSGRSPSAMGIWHSVRLEPACMVGVMVVLYRAEHTPLLFTAATISSRVNDSLAGKQFEPSELRQPPAPLRVWDPCR